jgi:hypothetical protein
MSGALVVRSSPRLELLTDFPKWHGEGFSGLATIATEMDA